MKPPACNRASLSASRKGKVLAAVLACVVPLACLHAEEAATVVLKDPVRFTVGAGEIVVPAGTRVTVEKAGDPLTVGFGGGYATVARDRTDAPAPAAAAPELPASLPAAAPPSGDDAPGVLDALLANPKIPLDPVQRAAIVRDAVARQRWVPLSRLLGQGLLADTKSGFVDQHPWISRLRLAQAFVWLGTPERTFATAQIARLARQARLVGHPLGEEAKARLIEGLGLPGEAGSFSVVFGDAENFPHPDILARRIKPETLIALLANQPLIDLLGETVVEADYQPGVWRVLADLQEHRPAGMAEFPALAVALAVVYDQPFPADWPHGQVDRAKVPFIWNNWNALFDYFLDAQRDGKLLADLGTLSPAQLRFMVDLPLERSELDWVQANVRTLRAAFEKVFFSIKYDEQRIDDRVFSWPDRDYRLARISALGGICIDQAYFTAMAGKAKGLPTLFFTGQGSFGGHAWFGYLRKDGWFLDGGRYAPHNYVTGFARDPQTWERINDHRLAFLNAPVGSVTLYNYSRNLLLLAMMPGVRDDVAERKRLVSAALAVDPKLPEIWSAVADALRELGQAEALRQHYQLMAIQFSGQDDLRVEALHALAFLEEEAGRPDAAEKARNQILAARSDLAIAEAAEIVLAKVREGDYASSAARFQEFLSQFIKRAKREQVSMGDLFHELVVPYALTLDAMGKHKEALDAIEGAKSYFDLEGVNNLIADDFQELYDSLAKQKKVETKTPAPAEEIDRGGPAS
jgi:hypothetical protein